MKNEERIAKLTGYRATAEAKALEYNAAMQEARFADAIKIEEDITKAVNEYTALARTMCFDACKNTPNPMLTAIQTLQFVTIAVRDEKIEDEKLSKRTIVEKNMNIDLVKLHKYCEGIGHDKDWYHLVQKMNYHLTLRQCERLDVDPKSVKDSYLMSEVARSKDFGKNPTSNTTLLKTLQTVITAMLGEQYKAKSHDVNYLVDIYCKKKNGKALTVSVANHKYLVNYLAEICHRIVTDGRYGVDFKADPDKLKPIDPTKPVEKKSAGSKKSADALQAKADELRAKADELEAEADEAEEVAETK